MNKTKFLSKNEEYIVKFFLIKKDGIVEQKEESVWFFSKDKKKQAEKEILNKYRGQGYKINIISVSHQ